MLKFKGRLTFIQYMPRKPIKRGMKAFSLNESKTGYTCAWKLYTGADNTKYSKIIKKYLEVLQSLKPKEKNIDRYITFYFLLYLL